MLLVFEFFESTFQLPLPDHMNQNTIIAAISPQKDVDGLHVHNAGSLFQVLHLGSHLLEKTKVLNRDKQFGPAKTPLVSCTPLGCIELIRRSGYDIAGKVPLRSLCSRLILLTACSRAGTVQYRGKARGPAADGSQCHRHCLCAFI